MPIYEYYCEECHGVFELLRSVRSASDSQPCIVCDADSRRIVSRDFAAFTVRNGYPRRLPDRGTFWHRGREVSRPIDRPTPPNEHHELLERPPERTPTVEELEEMDRRLDQRDQAHQIQRETIGSPVVNPREDGEIRNFSRRLRAPGTPRQERVKRQFVKKRRERERGD